MNFTVKGLLGFALMAIVMLSGCKTSQPSVYGGGTGISPKPGDEDLPIRDVFSRDLPSFRVTPERTDKYEDFAKLQEESDNLNSKNDEEVNTAYNINDPLEDKLSQLHQARAQIKQIMGYRILIYSGNDASRANQYVDTLEVMMNPKEELVEPSLPKLPVSFEYIEPNYVVKIGNYFSRLAAHHQYIQLNREEFPQSLVISEPIPLYKAMMNKMGQGLISPDEKSDLTLPPSDTDSDGN